MQQAFDKIDDDQLTDSVIVDHSQGPITVEEALFIFRQSCQQYVIYRNLERLSKTGACDCDDIAF